MQYTTNNMTGNRTKGEKKDQKDLDTRKQNCMIDSLWGGSLMSDLVPAMVFQKKKLLV